MDRIISYSPFRISFGGGGTDINPFCDRFGSAVLNATIDRGVTVTYTRDAYELEISSRDFLKSFLVSSSDDRGVLNGILELFRNSGIDRGRLAINSGVPPGSGLGSSSALINALLLILKAEAGKKYDPYSLAKEAYELESNYFGITLGKQDPYAISIGGLKLMQFQKESVSCRMLDHDSGKIKDLERRILLVYTGNTRESSNVLRSQVELSAKLENPVNRTLENIKDTAMKMADALDSGDLNRFSTLINEGWELKKKVNPEVSNEKIENIIGKAMANGADAARLMGGGKEGFVLLVAKPGKVELLQKSMMQLSEFTIRISFDEKGTRLIQDF
ncbi:MAG: kinase [Thermoplasmataceae archaeon]|jgi:D-glycero-alpha-D-manno-heptose-7-phosphate kinase